MSEILELTWEDITPTTVLEVIENSLRHKGKWSINAKGVEVSLLVETKGERSTLQYEFLTQQGEKIQNSVCRDINIDEDWGIMLKMLINDLIRNFKDEYPNYFQPEPSTDQTVSSPEEPDHHQ